MAIVGRTRVPPGSLGTALRHEIQQIDPDLPVYNLWTLAEPLERNYWFQRIIGILFLIFGGVALLLASIGLYASMAHSVSQRTQEIGIAWQWARPSTESTAWHSDRGCANWRSAW
jgi:putative ABC transport system permease protein